MKKKIFIVTVLILILALLIGILFIDKDNNETEKIEKPKVITAGIYTLVSNPTKFQQKSFNKLKEIIEKDELNEKILAETIVKNFIAEFYTLSNVNNRTVRGTQFVAKELKNRFIAFGDDVYTYYAYYTNKKDLEVKDVEIKQVKEINYNYNDELKEIETKRNLMGYEITTRWSYRDKTKYDTIVTIVKWDENYSIIKLENKI